MDCDACEPVCPVEAIHHEDHLPDDLHPHLADNEAFCNETLPGRDAPLGSPRGAAKVGPLGVDAPLVASRPKADKSRRGAVPVSEKAGPGEDAGRRRAVLRVLRASPNPLSILNIAEELGVHPNTVRFHLESLVRDGQVQQVQPARRGPGRPPLMFAAVRQMDRGGTRHYRLLAEILTNGIAAEEDSSGRALAAGREWGKRLEAPPVTSVADSIDHLVDLLDGLGFAPERREAEGKTQVGLRHCPFLELAETRSTVVCPVHLGLMRGALETWAAPVTVERLEAFVEPDLCLAHLQGVPA
ncbi:hypothetical protein Mkiyose1088_29280 [Mycobacterium kiyosense]|nr:hypothetical protein SRL2020130_12940 [Mycobacterium kiyosense]GLC01230.1 hypothetical protein SRL2020400_18210 [Mycobacterium kiyosense]GLC12600.1 hypothetical protein SRL2020448_12030 [Mycobacterium kiyosense]GLC19505.1 hypothetical protein SRL2020472_20760 [Mycobacterium kiyosense]GLD01062.1 hypothetical protein Mkiyose1088_29280 [Mycobacterium kiyosense]